MKVLITGAAGFLGVWFLDHFVREGFADVWPVDIVPHPQGYPMDQQDLSLWLDDFEEDIDLAIHLAAPVGGRMLTDYNSMHVADAFRLDAAFFRWAVKHAKTAVYASGASVYPLGYQDEGILHPLLVESYVRPEGYVGEPDGLAGLAKLAGERMAYGAATQHGLDVLVIRPFSGYGPHQSRDHAVTAILERAIRRENPLVVWGSGDQIRDYIHVSDIVGATLAKVEEGVHGFEVLNLGYGKGISLTTLAVMAADAVAYKPEIAFDRGRPEGPFQRIADVSLLKRIYVPQVALVDGIQTTIEALRQPRLVPA